MKAALIVPVRAAILDAHRPALDPSHALGLPPHVTVLFPFGAPSEIGADGLAHLARVIEGVPAFGAEFASVDWFGRDVAWLRPVDDTGFRELTAAVHAAFPRFRPYGGAHDEVIPHLTIGTAPPAALWQLREAAANVRQALPIRTSVDAVDYGVLTGDAHSWTVRHRLPLGSPDVGGGP